MTPMNSLTRAFVALALAGGLAATASAQAPSSQTATQPQTGSVTLPTVTVTAQKEPADVQRVPVSVTVVPIDWLMLGSSVSDAGVFSPNTYFSEFTARKLTNPRFRGIRRTPP
jgi:outer membrane receptor protein involved in Fe transport